MVGAVVIEYQTEDLMFLNDVVGEFLTVGYFYVLEESG